ncbi:Gfo/Idh/MocA family protein [Neptuniibacter halophilus]|uniref:Gfo/Idh/MocA family protein n=1 Tax=Neptuniibacter halophilus TaxID=651666 RepID=UPI002573741D|nr:Gfo/Idh/MocA family oxidoreductase [Neptuniibacter halophilus]
MVLLIGAGNMAREYAKVLVALSVNFTVVGRGECSAKKFEDDTGFQPYIGGLERFVKSNDVSSFEMAINTAPIEELAGTTSILIENNIKKILVEKPVALTESELDRMVSATKRQNAKVFVAYNRRFYSSVLAAKKIIERDGGVSSFNFEFTEWAHVISGLNKPEQVKSRWFLANSTHVTDLAFHLGGRPAVIKCFNNGAGELPWHTNASNFAGAGISTGGALFTYQANWTAPGRWALEILTKKNRIYFRPLEKLSVQKIGEIAVNEVPIADEDDKLFKPGIYQMVKDFIKENSSCCSLDEHIENNKYYFKISGY